MRSPLRILSGGLELLDHAKANLVFAEMRAFRGILSRDDVLTPDQVASVRASAAFKARGGTPYRAGLSGGRPSRQNAPGTDERHRGASARRYESDAGSYQQTNDGIGYRMSAQARLSGARQRIEDGQYDEALADLIRFHDNALLESRAWSGVRRAYALYDWIRLGGLYPPAMAALHNVRDGKAAGLLDGRLDRPAFQDVAAIDDVLATSRNTCAPYRQLMVVQPDLARECAQSALPSIVAAQDYQLAAQLVPEPDSAIRMYAAQLNEDVREIKRRRYTRAPVRWAFIWHYLERLRRLQALAIALIRDPSLRREVRNGFVKLPRAPSMKR
ncbi:hypothetical protein HAV22_20555 [Massilia sp. TW-1]|uniref:Uncharacterized protein n=1 Tax=Telluria antibiotica TaxID=2717319 RepID=A0ABX0PHU8_9BURK|nr:hypothetical protein [Telluria antibiotica]NIA56028.1 hypothetical protein [Telluria antibiotica]